MCKKTTQRGFTLVEMIVVIVIMALISGMISLFMQRPIQTYFASARRAGMSDAADTTIRRMARDIRKSLPGSIVTPTTTPANQCLEFIPTKTGGRYRADLSNAGTGDFLNFAAADTSFNMLGNNSPLPDQAIVKDDLVAIYNLGIPGADAYAGDNISKITAVAAGVLANETNITIDSKLFPLASGGNRFHIIPKDEHVVAYVCSGGMLYRTVRDFKVTAAAPACPATGAVLARNISSCEFIYGGADLQRNALVQLGIKFSSEGETISLFHEIHVDNTP